jgi:hypothetical protein
MTCAASVRALYRIPVGVPGAGAWEFGFGMTCWRRPAGLAPGQGQTVATRGVANQVELVVHMVTRDRLAGR